MKKSVYNLNGAFWLDTFSVGDRERSYAYFVARGYRCKAFPPVIKIVTVSTDLLRASDTVDSIWDAHIPSIPTHTHFTPYLLLSHCYFLTTLLHRVRHGILLSGHIYSGVHTHTHSLSLSLSLSYLHRT